MGEGVGGRHVPHSVERVAARASSRRATSRPAPPRASSTAASSSSWGTTRVTNPMRSASAAPTTRPVSMSSRAFFGGHGTHHGHGDHVRPQPDVDLGRTEAGPLRGHHHVAGQGQAEPAGQRPALDPGDGRLAEPHRGPNTSASTPRASWVARKPPPAPPPSPAIPAQVGAGTEGLVARPGEHHHPHGGVRPWRVPGPRAARAMTSHDMALRRSGRLMVMRATPSDCSWSTTAPPEELASSAGGGEGTAATVAPGRGSPPVRDRRRGA